MDETSVPDLGLLTLPDELVITILSHLSMKCLLRCTSVCSRLHNILKNSVELQYQVELAADGLVDGIGCTLSTSERLSRLLELRRRWRFLEWTSAVTIQGPTPAYSAAYELVDGSYAAFIASGESPTNRLVLTSLPTTVEASRTLEMEYAEQDVRDFAIDASQDLIAMVGVTIGGLHTSVPLTFDLHLRTIAGNKPHPKAANAVLRSPILFFPSHLMVQIVDHIIGAFFWTHDPLLLVWNWHTGTPIMVRRLKIPSSLLTVYSKMSSGVDLPSGTYDFNFLSNRAFMLTATDGDGSILLYSFDDGSSHPPTHAKVARLHLPPTLPGRALREAFTHSAPFVAQPTAGRPFETARETRIHVLNLRYGDIPSRRHLSLFVHNRFLTSCLPPPDSALEDFPCVERVWDDWGPANTRLVDFVGPFLSVRYIHGARVVASVINRDPRLSGLRIMVLDFNCHPARRDDPTAIPTGIRWPTRNRYHTIVEDPLVIEPGDVFRSPVVSTLPYAVTTRTDLSDAVGDYSGLMIDREQLVGMRVCDDALLGLDISECDDATQPNSIPRPHTTTITTLSYLTMGDILITIPGATAHHILGESNVTLGAGDLTIVPNSDTEKSLMLSVGSAAFSLNKGTPVGTLEGDSRAYVFSPEIEGVTGGFVKVTLPEGVMEDGSRLSELQTKFEELLIEHELLQPAAGEGTAERIKKAINSEPLVTIPGTVAAQVLGEETTILSEGLLSLVLMPKSEEDGPLLTLTVGKSAFPLYKSTTFGTLDGDSRTYLFTPDVEGLNKGFVAIVLPESPAALTIDLAELQNQFELILIEHDLLKDGFEAAADEFARSVREDSARTAQRIRASRDTYLTTHPRTIEPTHFSPAAHTITGGTASGTQSIANVAHRVSGAVMAGAA
ncbi:hypothetical protein C8Q80DRAFT_1347854, partial [Daedaleopsis nitida]